MALCSRDSRSFISKEEEEEIKSFTSQSSFYISFTNKVRLSAPSPSDGDGSRRDGIRCLHLSLSELPFTPTCETLSWFCRFHSLLGVKHTISASFQPPNRPFLSISDPPGRGGDGSSHLKSSSLGIRNVPANTSSGHFGTPHNTCSSLLAGSEWRGCRPALW